MVFSKRKILEKQIENFITITQKCGLLFKEAMRDYLAGADEDFLERVSKIKRYEGEADKLRTQVEHKLYTDMLIPDSRGDVLGLLETMDDVADEVQRIILIIDIERPKIPDELKEDFLKLADYSEQAIDELTKAVTAFFTDIGSVSGHASRVYFYEKEVDRVVEKLKRQVFKGDIYDKFSHKFHMRYFIDELAKLSDVAEDVCHRLSISVIKRSI